MATNQLNAAPQHNELQSLVRIQQAIISHLDHQVVLQHTAAVARELTDSQRAVVFLLEGDQLRIVAASGDDQAATMTGYQMPVAGSLISLALGSGEPVHIQYISLMPPTTRMFWPIPAANHW